MQTAVQISIHALRVEGDHLPLSFLHTVLYFYPRPPGWRATTVGRIACAFEQFLSTPSGWRATSSRVLCSQVHFFSIHALRVEGDPPGAAGGSASKRGFLSTPSGWRATEAWRKFCCSSPNFYPRPPGGGRLKFLLIFNALRVFLSTPSGWRATANLVISPLSKLSFLSTPSGWRATQAVNCTDRAV